jgi:TonB family protein
MQKETFFSINRLLLVTIVLFSLTIPLLPLPQIIQFKAPESLMPAFDEKENPEVAQPETESLETSGGTFRHPDTKKPTFASLKPLLPYAYLTGLSISILLLIYSILSVLVLFRKARVKHMNGFRLVIIDREIPAFSFSHFIFISQQDYDDHRQALLAHEQAHIQLNHFFDLILLETVKTFHWFNPVMYWLIRDLKEIHEFQADDYVLSNGIDSTQYQLLIIKKCVGTQRFSLANSFNYCQIKKRIAMINKQKTGKSGRWKVAAFLPLMALLPMTFGKTAENAPPEKNVSSEIAKLIPQDTVTKVQLKIPEETKGKTGDNGKKGSIPETSNQSKPEVKKVDGAPASSQNYDNVFIIVEEMPEFPGGEQALRQYIATHINYPPEAQKNNISGKVYVTFVVNPNGKVDRAKIVRGIDPALDAEALKVVNSFPDWTPGRQRGEAVAVAYTVPVTFGLTSTVTAPGDSLKPVFIMVEEMPEFPGGEQALRQYIATHVNYPPEAQKNNISGKVYVTFVVNSNGKVDRAKIVRGIDPALDAEALRVVSTFPDWIPGKQRGKAVDVSYTVPVTFGLASNVVTQTAIITSAHLIVDERPVFPGGESALQELISGQLKYPAEALKEKIQGEVLVGFVVKSEGKVESVKVLRGVHPLLDAEAIRVVSMLPTWKPGIKEGKAVDVPRAVSVKFILP